MRRVRLAVLLAAVSVWSARTAVFGAALVLQTDFGVKDGAVAAMKGVAFGVEPALPIFDLTHEIPAFSAWDAGYRLGQTAPFWPAGTVFVNVVDPGVGTDRLPVVAKTKSGQYVVTPDNGALTFLDESPGLESVRVIDMAKHRRPGSEASYTFHGRDLFAYVGAQLAAGKLSFEDVGPESKTSPVRLVRQAPELKNGELRGGIPVLDPQYGNVWSTIPKALVDSLKLKSGDKLEYKIYKGGHLVRSGVAPYVTTFGAVPKGHPLIYINSLLNLSLALNQGDFAARYGIHSGAEWSVRFRKAAY
jgi:S-adenosylmethionine hydrolase